jgi:hypothetical protein
MSPNLDPFGLVTAMAACRDGMQACGTFAVRLPAEAIPVQDLGRPAGQPQRTTAVQGRVIAGKARAVTGSIAEMVLRCPPFT